MSSINHRYVVYLADDRKPECYPIYVPKDAEVDALRRAILSELTWNKALKEEQPTFLKCGQFPIMDVPSREYIVDVAAWIRKHAENERMAPTRRLNRYFPDGPAAQDSDLIDIILVTDSILESPDVVYALPDVHASNITKDRGSLIKRMYGFPSPSEGVKNEENLKAWTNEDSGVHAHRPTGNHGPPTALFHPALARLKRNLTHLDQIEEPSATYYRKAHEFINLCSSVYQEESSWEGGLRGIIGDLTGEMPRWQANIEGGTVKPDAVWQEGEIIRAILELRNMDGVYGNASLQCLLDYTKILMQRKYSDCVRRSNCPIILIGIMGSRLEISTAIFTDGVYADKLLSEDFYIDAWQFETVMRVGRIFKALAIAIAELREYYETIALNLNPCSTIKHLYPDPLPLQGFVIPRLNYVGKLTRAGQLLDAQNNTEIVNEERPYALYRAKMTRDEPGDEVDVVVKFTVHYHEEAHRILAEKELAPVLHFCIPLAADMYMVIMDYVDSAPIFCAQGPRDNQRIYNDVEEAVDLLHQHDLVFGDLRVQNIVPKPGGGAMLIDFDWVGRHEVDRYPASWNDKDKNWAPSVERRALMDKAHDIFMLEKLGRLLDLPH